MPENTNNIMKEGYIPTIEDVGIQNFDPASLKTYKNIPQFEGTVGLPINAGDFGVEVELKVPTSDSTIYLEKGKKGFKFTKEGRALADYNWNAVLAISGSDADLETIKENATNILRAFQTNPNTNPEFNQLLKRGFEARIAYMEKEKFWAEMEASNSPWNGAIETIAKKFYPEIPLAFVKNFATNAIRGVREEIAVQVGKFVEEGKVAIDDKEFVTTVYEAWVANHIKRHLEDSKPGKIQKLRKGGIRNLTETILDEKRFTNHDPEGKPLAGYMAKTLEGVLREKEQITEIRAENISSTSEEAVQPPSDKEILLTSRERLSARLQGFRAKILEAFSTPASRRRALGNLLLATSAGLSLFVYSKERGVSSIDIASSLINGPTPISQQVFHNMEPALSVSKQDKKNTDVLAPAKVTPIDNTGKAATIQPTETTTTAPTQKAEVTHALSPTLENPFVVGGIDFTNENPVSLSTTIDGVTLKNSFTPIVYDPSFTPTEVEAFLEKVEPGNGTAAVDKDKYGNTILYIHSGYKGQTPLEAEMWRQFIEGGDKNPDRPMLSERQRQENMNALVGQVVQVKQNGVVKEFVISAVGYIPHDKKDEFEQAGQIISSLDVLIEATGDENSPFRIYRGGERNALFLTFCGWGPRSEKNWWGYSRYVFALEPVEQVQKYENILPLTDPKEAAQVLVNAINTADERGFEHGEVLRDSIKNQLIEAGVEINEKMDAKLGKIPNETVERDLQCIMGTELTAHLPGTEDWADIGGFRIYDPENADKIGDGRRGIRTASELWKDMSTGEKIEALENAGAATNEDGVIRMRVDKVSMLAAGDIVAIDSHSEQPVGHVARVIDVWIDNDGKYHALIFDVNFANDGRARLVEITDENMDEVLANTPEGQSARIIVIRSYKSHEAWSFARVNIQP